MEERRYSLREAQEILGISERTIHRWIKSGKLKSYKPGRDHQIPQSAIRKVLEESEVYPKVQSRLWPEEEEPERRDAETAERLIGFGERMVARFDSELEDRTKAEDLDWFAYALSMYKEYVAILNTVQGRGVANPQEVLGSIMDMNAVMQTFLNKYEEVVRRRKVRSDEAEVAAKVEAREKTPR